MNSWAMAAFKHVTACVIVCALCTATLQAAESTLFMQPPPRELPEEKAPGDVFPAIDLSYALHDDNGVNLHTWSARVGLGVVTDWCSPDSLEWIFPAFRFLYEESDTGGIVRRGYLASFEYHFQMHDWSGNMTPKRPDFPLERRNIVGAMNGFEVGFVEAENLFTVGKEKGVRIGNRGRLAGIFAEISGNIAVEIYGSRKLYELGLTLTPLIRPLLPYGPFIGYRHTSTKGFIENAFVIGFEANF